MFDVNVNWSSRPVTALHFKKRNKMLKKNNKQLIYLRKLAKLIRHEVIPGKFVSLTGNRKVGEASRHVRTATGLASLSRSLATRHNRTSAGHQLHPGSGVTATPIPEREGRETIRSLCEV